MAWNRDGRGERLYPLIYRIPLHPEKGEGDAPAPAIINAIYDAIGVRFDSLPVTPGKVLQALHEKERKDKTI